MQVNKAWDMKFQQDKLLKSQKLQSACQKVRHDELVYTKLVGRNEMHG